MKFSEIRKKNPPSKESSKKSAETAPSTKTEIQWPSRPAPRASQTDATGTGLESQKKTARRIYGQSIDTISQVIDRIERGPVRAKAALNSAVEAIIKALAAGNQSLLAMAACSTQKDYLPAHSVNTAIFAVWTGQGFAWSPRDLHSLGIGALLADLGMIRLRGLASQPRELSEPEREPLRLHPVESQKLLDHIEDMDPPQRQWISELIGQEHAWKSNRAARGGSGRGADIPNMARVLAQCDQYEALTHPRAWRKALSAHAMIKGLLKQPRDEFGAVLVKNFVGRFSLFPPGCFVQLSTQECGYVVSIQEEMPTRPTVELWVRADGGAFSPPSLLDLVENPTTHIAGAIEESQAGIKDPDLLKQLEAARWWTE